MDRQTRKANLKKLQLPSTSGNKQQQRKTRQTAKTTSTTNTIISNYFSTPEKHNKDLEEKTKETHHVSPVALELNKPSEELPESSNIPQKPATRTRVKRTKLDDFIFKDPNNIPECIKTSKKPLNDDDLVVPEKKAKRAPKLTLSGGQTKNSKSSRSKKQTTIKSAFLRNEQLFAEIAAQHCAADQFDGDDIQLALAISKSEAESKGIKVVQENAKEEEVNLADNGTNDAESIREKLKKYGFRTAEKKDYNTFAAAFLPKTTGRRAKSKWANKFTSLTLRNPENQLKKLQDNIEKLLNSQFRTKPLSEQENCLPPYILQSSLLKKSHVHENKPILENIENINQPNDRYFVNELFEINQLPAGHLLKDWTAIQGRDLTPRTKTKQTTERLQKLQTIYQELEEYFSSRKRLDWTVDNDGKEEKESKGEVEDNMDGSKDLNEMVDLIEDLQKNEAEIETIKCAEKVLKLLPTTKSLDIMQVSGCSMNSQVTINTTQKEDHAEYVELDEMIDLIENMQRNEVEMESIVTPPSDKKMLKLLPTATSSENIQSAINTTQKEEVISNATDISGNAKHVELVEMIDLIDDMQRNEVEMESAVTPPCDNRILKLLPIATSLDTMQVSSCGLNTQATTNTTQKTRSNSPDLFADSDVEMEECDRENESCKTEVQTVLTFPKDKSRNSSTEEIDDAVSTYEIFSSDEVKNTTSSEQHESITKETSTSKHLPDDDNVIDLTQDDLQNSPHKQSNTHLNQSKALVEIDLFADSPSQEEDHDVADINSNSQISKYVQEETFRFTLSMETNENEEYFREKKKEDSFKLSLETSTRMETNDIEESFTAKKKIDSFNLSFIETNDKEYTFREKKKENSFKLSLSLETQEKFKETNATNHELQEEELDDDDDIVLREIAMDQTNTSFLNFQGSKQLETCFHKETATKEKEIIKDSLTGNDTIFRDLCSKYLDEANNTSATNELQKTDLLLPTIKTPEKCENFTNFTMDFDMTVDNNLNLKRKSMSFTAKTPLKMDTVESKTTLAKSHSFNNSKMPNVSIDLTQNEVDSDEEEPAEDEDDECLVLSDDEINYSIWQANKTGNFQTSEQSDHEDDVISIPDDEEAASDEEQLGSSKEQIIEFPDKMNDLKEFSFTSANRKDTSLIKIDLQPEQSYSDFEVLTSKYSNTRTPPPDELIFDRSDFGILEEYSEPIDYTPNLCTPAKVLNEASFLSSPTETTAPMKRYSNCHRSSQKFQDLINNMETKSPTYAASDLNDFDEFDRLVYTSPLKVEKTSTKPQGIEQLLTAEISFKASQTSPKATPTKTIPTNSTQEITYNNKTYTLRHTNSPKPDYTKYSEAELLKDLYNFGIKPLKRKQAVKMLEYIYNQTHPILMEEDTLENEQQEDAITMEEFERPSTSKAALTAKQTLTKPQKVMANIPNESEKETMVENSLDVCNKKLNLQDSCGLDMLRYSLDLKAELCDEQYILQTNVTKKTPQPLLPFHIAWYNLVCSNRKLHETILMYEPIDLQEIYLFLKSIGYRYDPKDLKIFFDRRCIIFRYDLASAAGSNGKTKDTNRRVRKSKKTKVSKK